MGGGATLGRSQGEGVMMEDLSGSNSSFTVSGSTKYNSGGHRLSKSAFAKLLEQCSSYDLSYVQVNVKDGRVTEVFL